MQIFLLQEKKVQSINRNSLSLQTQNSFRAKLKNQSGLALIEILVSSLLMVILLAALNIGSGSGDADLLDKELDNIDRAIRYAVNEAILQGSMARVKFHIDKIPNEFSVEIGPKDGFVLPEFPTAKSAQLSSEDRIARANLLKSVDQEFEPVDGLEESKIKIDDRIRLIGVGKANQGYLINDFNASIYLFPSGEKDDFIVLIGTDSEVGALIIEPYSANTRRSYQTLPEIEGEFTQDKLNELQDQAALDLYEEWRST